MSNSEVTVRIHGRDYKIQSFKDPEYTKKLAGYCDEVMKSVEAATGSTDYLKLLVLSLLQVAHSYIREAEKPNDALEKMDEKFQEIISQIEKTEAETDKLEKPAPEKK